MIYLRANETKYLSQKSLIHDFSDFGKKNVSNEIEIAQIKSFQLLFWISAVVCCRPFQGFVSQFKKRRSETQ